MIGAGHALSPGQGGGYHRMFDSISDLLGTLCDDQKGLWTLSKIPGEWGAKLSPLRNSAIKYSSLDLTTGRICPFVKMTPLMLIQKAFHTWKIVKQGYNFHLIQTHEERDD